MVRLCKHYYLEGRKLSPAVEGDTAPPIPYSNFYLILAAQLKISIFVETSERWWSLCWCVCVMPFLLLFLLLCCADNMAHLWEAIFLLEFGGRSDAQIAVLLMKLYGYLGATEPITEIFDSISIKNIQIETLGCAMCNVSHNHVCVQSCSV